MPSQYLAQYLLNTGVLGIETVRQLLIKASRRKPQLPVLAMQHKLLKAGQLEEFAGLSTAKFKAAVEEKGLLTKVQIKNLQDMPADDDLRFAQVMLDKKVAGYTELEKLITEWSSSVSPLQEAVGRAAGQEVEKELGDYSDYVEVFVHTFMRFMGGQTVVDPDRQTAVPKTAEPTHMVSQRLSGDRAFVVGIVAQDDVFLELARHYSKEELVWLNPLAEDSMEEFLNVVNGLYAVELSKRDLEIDLELPHTVKNTLPMGNLQLTMRLFSAFGDFSLVLSSDEFLA